MHARSDFPEFRASEAFMQIIPLHTNDRVQLKKKHPCGGNIFEILRVGSDVRVRCETCSRDMTIDRVKLEKSIRAIVSSNHANLEVTDRKD